MASEQRLYSFPQDTKDELRKFRLSSSRAKEPQARIYEIDKKTLAVQRADDDTYSSLQDLADALPANAPRFVLLSLPLETRDGRLSVPYALLHYMPQTCASDARMLYAGARELFRSEAAVTRVLDVSDDDEVLEVREVLAGKT